MASEPKRKGLEKKEGSIPKANLEIVRGFARDVKRPLPSPGPGSSGGGGSRFLGEKRPTKLDFGRRWQKNVGTRLGGHPRSLTRFAPEGPGQAAKKLKKPVGRAGGGGGSHSGEIERSTVIISTLKEGRNPWPLSLEGIK